MYKFVKRAFDLVSSLLLFILISPFFLFLMFLVRIKLGTPVFFKQTRTGLHMKQFTLFKFRTMTDDRDENGDFLPDEQRLTLLGKRLRSSSLDELPELLSIIKGDMSVIGPRPLPPCYDNYYTDREKMRFEVRGGLIPPDSVDRSSIISWDRQFEYEAEYAQHIGLRKDVKILLSAVKIIIKRRNVDYGAFVRMPLNIERNTVEVGSTQHDQ